LHDTCIRGKTLGLRLGDDGVTTKNTEARVEAKKLVKYAEGRREKKWGLIWDVLKSPQGNRTDRPGALERRAFQGRWKE